jgi:hypothetical protein
MKCKEFQTRTTNAGRGGGRDNLKTNTCHARLPDGLPRHYGAAHQRRRQKRAPAWWGQSLTRVRSHCDGPPQWVVIFICQESDHCRPSVRTVPDVHALNGIGVTIVMQAWAKECVS